MKMVKCFLDDSHTTYVFITPYAARIGARDKTTKLISHTPFVLQKVNISQEQKKGIIRFYDCIRNAQHA